MDSAHDLGGKQGYGPIDVDEAYVPFKSEWEGRAWAVVWCCGSPDWTLDWWRHIREAIDPIDYLTRPYFDSWTQTQIAGYIDSGVFTLEELLTESSTSATSDQPSPITIEEAIEEDRNSAFSFEAPIDSTPRFNIGEKIVTSLHGSSHHTRLPSYARGKVGEIAEYHGAHIFPDKNAQGIEEAGHLYSVAFDSGTLWSDSEHPHDMVYLDLWEAYLDAC